MKVVKILFFILVVLLNKEVYGAQQNNGSISNNSNRKVATTNIKHQQKPQIKKENLLVQKQQFTQASLLQNYQNDKEKIEINYSHVKRGLLEQAIKNSKSQDMKNFFEMLNYSKIKEKKDMYDEFLIYQFLANRYSSIKNKKLEDSVRKARDYVPSSPADYSPSPLKLIDQYKKNHVLSNDENFKKKVRDIWYSKKFSNSVDERNFMGTFASILTKEDHNKRLEWLLWAGESDSAQRILSKVDNETRNKARHRLSIQTSETIAELFKKLDQYPQNDYGNQVLLFDAINWCKKRKMDTEMMELLDMVPLKNRIHNEQWWNLIKPGIRDLLASGTENHYRLAYKIANSHGISNKKNEYSEAEFLTGFIAFNYLKNYELAAKHFVNSLKYSRQDFRQSRGMYWLALSYEKIGDSGGPKVSKKSKSDDIVFSGLHNDSVSTTQTYDDNKEDLKQIDYKALAKTKFTECSGNYTSFYGQLCLEKIGKLDTLRSKLVHISENDVKNTLANPVFKYYYYSLLTKNSNLAKKLAKIVTLSSKSKGEVAVLAGIANHLNLPEISVYIGNIALYNMSYAVLEAMYPAPNYKHMKFNKVLNLSIIKRESNFLHDEVNDAGSRGKANGLMQIIPAAGIDVAKMIGVQYDHSALMNPQVNVMFGNHFLEDLYNRLGKSVILTIGAYNGGASSIKKWIARNGDIRDFNYQNNFDEKILWIEKIPFRETRYYVQSVLANMVIYNAVLHPDRKIDGFFKEII